MAQSERKRQEKLVRKAAKRKERLRAAQHASVPAVSAMTGTQQMAAAEKAPIYECLVPASLFEMGIGNVIFSRRIGSDTIGFSAFLVDVYCLGIKNAFYRAVPRHEYEEMVRKWSHDGGFQAIEPACLRKLVEDAEAYARDLGFSPHPDYHVSRRLFADVDPSACRMSFTFGKDGKPFYVSGPHDSPAKSRRIVETLTQRCGRDGFHFMALVGASSPFFDAEDEEQES